MGGGRRRFLVGGNWKMNGNLGLIERMCRETLMDLPDDVDVVVAPPAPYLLKLKATCPNNNIQVCAQNIHEASSGAFTGEMSGGMLMDLGIGWTLVGHSERRTLFGEGDTVRRD